MRLVRNCILVLPLFHDILFQIAAIEVGPGLDFIYPFSLTTFFSRSPPLRLVLDLVPFSLSLSLTPFFSRSPPSRLVLEFSSRLDVSQSSSPPLRLVLDRDYNVSPCDYLIISPVRRHWGWSWGFPPILMTISPAHRHWGWSWTGSTYSSTLPSFPLLLAAPPAGIQSDSDPMWSLSLSCSPPVAAMERSKVICLIQDCWRALGPPLQGLLWLLLWGHSIPCGCVPLSLLHSWGCSYKMPRATESSASFFSPPFSLLLKSVWVAFWRNFPLFSLLQFFLHVLLLSPKAFLGGPCMHWRRFWRCLLYGSHWLCLWLTTFWTTFLHWSGCASLLAGEEHLRGFWVSARCMSSFFVSRGFTKSWVGQVASRSPTVDFVVSLDDQGH